MSIQPTLMNMIIKLMVNSFHISNCIIISKFYGFSLIFHTPYCNQ